MKIYYLHDGKQQFGPFDLEELKNQPVTSSTMVWMQGMEKWAKASAVREWALILINLDYRIYCFKNPYTHQWIYNSSTIAKGNLNLVDISF